MKRLLTTNDLNEVLNVVQHEIVKGDFILEKVESLVAELLARRKGEDPLDPLLFVAEKNFKIEDHCLYAMDVSTGLWSMLGRYRSGMLCVWDMARSVWVGIPDTFLREV